MKIRDVYIGIDPLIEDLILTIIGLRDRVNELESVVEKRETTAPDDLNKWTGADFYNYYIHEHEVKYGEPPITEFRNDSYPKSRITGMLKSKDIDRPMYKAFIQYLIHDDPWVQNGTLPDARHLYNPKVFGLFVMRVRRGEVRPRAGQRAVVPDAPAMDADTIAMLKARAARATGRDK